jgi:hypothetical protein
MGHPGARTTQTDSVIAGAYVTCRGSSHCLAVPPFCLSRRSHSPPHFAGGRSRPPPLAGSVSLFASPDEMGQGRGTRGSIPHHPSPLPPGETDVDVSGSSLRAQCGEG